ATARSQIATRCPARACRREARRQVLIKPAPAPRSPQPRDRVRLPSSYERTSSPRKATASRISRQWPARGVNKRNWPEGGVPVRGSAASLAGVGEPTLEHHHLEAAGVGWQDVCLS